VALLTLFSLATQAGPESAAAIRFAPLPLEDKKIIREQFKGLVDYLSSETGLPIEWVHLTDYGDILEQFRQNKIDLAYLGPLPYVILKQGFHAAQSLGCFRDISGEASYTCSLVTNGDAGLNLESLKGVHFGLTQPYSTCGYLAVTSMLRKAGLTLEQNENSFRYAGSHSKAALGVVRGEFDVAGVKTAIALRYQHLDLVRIAESHHYPGFALVANLNTLDQTKLESLGKALLALQPMANPDDQQRVSGWGKHLRKGTVPASHCNYESVAEALRHIPWPIPGAQQ
jgi:phosphonate transport system substrate-binding protein